MTKQVQRGRVGSRLGRLCVVSLFVLLMSALVACGSDDDGAAADGGDRTASGERKLIVFAMPFPCGLNDYAQLTCDGAEAAAKELPPGYEFDMKTGIDYADVPAFNSLLETTLQLDPAGMVVFTNGPAAQTPVLNRACDQGATVIFYDTKGDGVKCAVSHVTPNHREMGEKAAQWLIDNPPKGKGKEVAIVSLQPGQFPSNDARVEGFKETIEAAGYDVVTTVVSTNDVAETRTKVTNALTAHPNLAAIYSANGPLGNGTEQALKGKRGIVQLTTDGNAADIPSVLDGTVGVNVAQAPYVGGRLAVEYMVKALEGEDVAKVKYTPSEAIDKSNAQEFLDQGGLH